MTIPKITLDTNCIINLFDVDAGSPTSVVWLNDLIRSALSNKVEVAVTTRVEADLLNDRDDVRKKEMLRRLEMVPVIGTVARWDVSRWDSGDVWAGDKDVKLEKELQRILFPGLSTDDKRYLNKQNDIDHLMGHLINRRDIFVTDDMGILKKREALKAAFALLILAPGECTDYLSRTEAARQPRLLEVVSTSKEKYHNRNLKGRASFDYSNNNGVFAIGDGYCLFETKWSKAGREFIHACSDAPSIDALALVRESEEISDIRDVARYDFSSRIRTPKVGQIVVWRNVNGLCAATKILIIKDDRRGDDQDALTFDYVIVPDGSADF